MTRSLFLLVFLMVSWPFSVFGADREVDARRLFVEAAKLRYSGPCEDFGVAGELVDLSILFGALFGFDDIDRSIECVKRLRDAAVIQQIILADYPETEAAFTLATQGYQTPKQLDALLRNLRSQQRSSARANVTQRGRDPVAAVQHIEDLRQKAAFERNDIMRIIQEQLRRCWRLNPGALQVEDMVVEIRVLLDPDGSVRRADILDAARMAQDGHFRSVAENAKRAIDMCSPFSLPPRKYDIWRELTLRFNPRVMFGP